MMRKCKRREKVKTKQRDGKTRNPKKKGKKERKKQKEDRKDKHQGKYIIPGALGLAGLAGIGYNRYKYVTNPRTKYERGPYPGSSFWPTGPGTMFGGRRYKH